MAAMKKTVDFSFKSTGVTFQDLGGGSGVNHINFEGKATGFGTALGTLSTDNRIFLGRDNREPGGNLDLDEVAIYNRPLSASEVAGHFAAGAGVSLGTVLPTGVNTYYFRKAFDFQGDAARTQLELATQIDDGAVFYLNGAEIYRQKTCLPDRLTTIRLP